MCAQSAQCNILNVSSLFVIYAAPNSMVSISFQSHKKLSIFEPLLRKSQPPDLTYQRWRSQLRIWWFCIIIRVTETWFMFTRFQIRIIWINKSEVKWVIKNWFCLHIKRITGTNWTITTTKIIYFKKKKLKPSTSGKAIIIHYLYPSTIHIEPQQ